MESEKSIANSYSKVLPTVIDDVLENKKFKFRQADTNIGDKNPKKTVFKSEAVSVKRRIITD